MVPGRKYSHMNGRCESASTAATYLALAPFEFSARLVCCLGKYSMTAVRPSVPIWVLRTPMSRMVYTRYEKYDEHDMMKKIPV